MKDAPGIVTRNYYTKELSNGRFRLMQEMFIDSKLDRETPLFFPMRDKSLVDHLAIELNNEAFECKDHIANHSGPDDGVEIGRAA